MSTREIPATAGATSPENPWPLRLLTSKLTEYLAKSPAVWLEGQVVQITRRAGTAYLTLRDTDVDLSFSLTMSSRVLEALPTPLTEGSQVVVHARAQLSPRRGALSLVADALRPVGVGELLARIEQLRRLLAAEGLFDQARKQPLPFLPQRVGLITGRASAAERDVVENARRRWPAVVFEIREVAVQGSNAVLEVSAAIAELDAVPQVEVIVVARGGGSLEDLLPFSNEAMLRAAAQCRTPLVSAIGHEVDTPLLDLVADARASTPTDAARRVVPDVAAELAGLAQARQRCTEATRRRLDREVDLIAALRAHSALNDPLTIVAERAEAIANLTTRARTTLETRLDRGRDDARHLRERVAALSPAATMARGYAVVQRLDGAEPGLLVRSPDQAGPGARLRIRVAAGELSATAD